MCTTPEVYNYEALRRKALHIQFMPNTVQSVRNFRKMKLLESNVNWSLSVCLTMLKVFGFWAPVGLSREMSIAYYSYGFISFMFILGTCLLFQVGELIVVWGDLELMTETVFLLFTNLVQVAKHAPLLLRRRILNGIVADADRVLRGAAGRGGDIVKSCNRETSLQFLLFFCMTTLTVTGFMVCAEKNQLIVRAWYPYDTSRSPAYELTYAHQVGALYIAAWLNVFKDVLITTLIAQCRCQLQLVGLGLRTLLEDLIPNERGVLTPAQEATAWARLRELVRHHQEALRAAALLQTCFSTSIFAQFSVSMVIICVTAFQLAAVVGQTGNLVQLFPMSMYLFDMVFQVFIYCYHGDRLSEESIEIGGAAYECPWYACSMKLRRGLLVVMARTRSPAQLTAGGLMTISLPTFMMIVKTSYSLFTVLQQADD